ncbi:transposon, En/Spm-like protein, partial [Tanacetum coccineum]
DLLHIGNLMPKTTHQVKKILANLRLSYEKNHACPNGCMLFWDGNKKEKVFSICGALRWKSAPQVASNNPDEVAPNDPDEVVGPQKKKEKGVETFDVATNEMFCLKAAVHSTIFDFPGYANLSRWSTKGEYACPVCAFDKSSNWIEHGRKWCYMGHRRWLQHDHCWHKDTKSFDEDENLRCSCPSF